MLIGACNPMLWMLIGACNPMLWMLIGACNPMLCPICVFRQAAEVAERATYASYGTPMLAELKEVR